MAQAHASSAAPVTPIGAIPIVLAPGWAELPWLVHGFSTRVGGVSSVYRGGETGGALNLGFTPSDDPEHVRENRERLLRQLLSKAADSDKPGEAGAPRLVTLRQTHSATIWRVSAADLQEPGAPARLEGDGLMTDEPGVLLGIQTADCVPVLVVDPVRRAVAGFHAGWRGTVAGIVEAGIARMEAEFGSRPGDLRAAIGPAIGACCYTVGEEVRDRFAGRFAYAAGLFPADPAEGSALRLDLSAANRRQLLTAGLREDSIHTIDACTSCRTECFFSHRAEHGATGRMLAVIGIRRSERFAG